MAASVANAGCRLADSRLRLERSAAPICRRKCMSQRSCSTAAGKRVIALDFDGVVCDSVGESSLSGFKAAARLWPDIFNTAAAESRKPELVEKMRAVRPVVETGYENIVQIRCLYEGVGVEDMLQGWEHMLGQRMKDWALDRSEMVELFGRVRDEWIRDDLAGWLAPNRIYDGVAGPVSSAMAREQVYIVTTKQAHYTEILMRDMAGIDFPIDRIFSQTVSGRPKGEVLHRLSSQHPDASALIFVEDKLGTLEKVSKDATLSEWQLYLVDWGYNTPQERQRASANPRIKVIGREEFGQLMA